MGLPHAGPVHGGVFEPLSRGLLDPDPDARLTPEGVLRVLREIGRASLPPGHSSVPCRTRPSHTALKEFGGRQC